MMRARARGKNKWCGVWLLGCGFFVIHVAHPSFIVSLSLADTLGRESNCTQEVSGIAHVEQVDHNHVFDLEDTDLAPVYPIDHFCHLFRDFRIDVFHLFLQLKPHKERLL